MIFGLACCAAAQGQGQAGQAQAEPAQPPAAAAQPAPATPGVKDIFWRPSDLHVGSVAFFTVTLDREATALSGTWLGKDLVFFPATSAGERGTRSAGARRAAARARRSGNAGAGEPGARVWHALAGADVETAPGNYDLVLKATLPSGSIAESTRSVSIAPSNYETVQVNVAPQFVTPDAEQQRIIAQDQEYKNKVFTRRIDHPLWSGRFIKPIHAASTPSFGAKRLFNEELTSLHRGTDFPAKTGTPVVASNSGEVVLARKLYYEGNCVMIDHGQQFWTIYMHLSKIEAREGEHIRKGQLLGLSGETGRVTGPHLHMGVRWEGAYLDPTKLLALPLPVLPQAQEARAPVRTRRHRRR